MSSTPQSSGFIPVEMSELDNSKREEGAGSGLLNDVSITTSPMTSDFPVTSGSLDMASENTRPAEPSKNAISTADPSNVLLSRSSNEGVASGSTTAAADPSSSNPTPITRLDSVAIGPSTDAPAPQPHVTASDAGPVLIITLLLTSGARHPYKIDEKYLTKRNVSVPGVTEGGKRDPFSISVYTLKELILREWREEWEAQPSSPSSIRLIFFGRLLDDKTPLKDCKFAADSANVVHMTVRPQDIVDEEDASKSKALARDREGGESTAGCRCVIL
ncbi:hypothetical protein D0Z07_0531 [Hyphodiscus hymeniophilus]|uniref:Ubiquitin-like domain-containing protein n=1 Tax=Hyphodiscus hymeniophilus TaxID=353542 RepID=A0A9P6VQT5_9HELO|nr:hypothetical protein D0Z07_0531 [Hyphodiscus hymeniophilus]